MKRVEWRAVRLRPETLRRLRAACSTMGVASPDALAERIILGALEHEDLLDPIPTMPSEHVEKMLNVRGLSLKGIR